MKTLDIARLLVLGSASMSVLWHIQETDLVTAGGMVALTSLAIIASRVVFR
jgi:hypothetical protein